MCSTRYSTFTDEFTYIFVSRYYFMQLHIRHTYEMPAFETFPSFAYNPVRILLKDNLSTSLKMCDLDAIRN